MTLTIETITNRDMWNNTLHALPYAHVLQTWEWGEFKYATTGWKPMRLAYKQGNTIVAMASVGVRQIGPLRVMYVAKGPAMPYDKPNICA
jgi:peptidoglycan pentaglycine glycine transferase (the first glycine)